MLQRRSFWMRQTSQRVSRRRALGILGAGTVAAYLAACGGDSENGSSGQTQGAQQSAVATPLAAAQGEETQFQQGTFGGKLKIGTTLEPGTLDTAIPLSGGDTVYLSTMYNPLVVLDHFVPNPKLSLAEKWEIVDPTTITFALRQGVKFHDGTDLDAEAVRWNLTRILDPTTRSAARSNLLDIDRVEAADKHTARFILKSPNATLLTSLGSVYGAGMASPAAVERWGKEFTSHPAGTGPFVFDQWVPGSHVTVKRNPTYWEKDAGGKALPYLDEVTIQAIPDDTVRYANLQTGEVHYAGINQKDWAAAEKNPDFIMARGLPGAPVNSVLVFNLDKPPMDNVNLRKAMAFALDPSVVSRNVYFGYAEVVDGGMRQPQSWSYGPVPGRPTYDVAKAKEFLQAGGQPNGFSVDVITYTSPQINQQTEVYQEQWSKAGIKAQITTQDVTTATDSFFVKGLFPTYSTSWSTTYFEPNSASSTIYAKEGYYNPMKRSVSPELDELTIKGRQTYDLEERKKIYQRIDEINMVEQCFFIPMLYSQGRGWFRKNVGNTDIFPWFSVNRPQSIFLKA
ncbi:MAG: ABC transporter substrate-binding protein [Dehalococcoidia bacterium]